MMDLNANGQDTSHNPDSFLVNGTTQTVSSSTAQRLPSFARTDLEREQFSSSPTKTSTSRQSPAATTSSKHMPSTFMY